jgi:hypothetical protein
MTAISVIGMGPDDEPMFWQWQGSFSYLLASGFLGWLGFLCCKIATGSWRSVQQVRTCPRLNFIGRRIRILDNPIPFSALIGFWQPELLVSQGLLNTLDQDHLEAVFKHEQGHYYYRDTFWFFWLGWLRSCTAWLPNTEALWQELLLLREMRAASLGSAASRSITVGRITACRGEYLTSALRQLLCGVQLCCTTPPFRGKNRCAFSTTVKLSAEFIVLELVTFGFPTSYCCAFSHLFSFKCYSLM